MSSGKWQPFCLSPHVSAYESVIHTSVVSDGGFALNTEARVTTGVAKILCLLSMVRYPIEMPWAILCFDITNSDTGVWINLRGLGCLFGIIRRFFPRLYLYEILYNILIKCGMQVDICQFIDSMSSIMIWYQTSSNKDAGNKYNT